MPLLANSRNKTNTFGYLIIKDAGFTYNLFLANVGHGEYDIGYDWRDTHTEAHVFFDQDIANSVVDYLQQRGEPARTVQLIGTLL